MITKNNNNIGCYWQLETSKDFDGDWRGFLKAVKRLRTVSYQPVELDDPTNWWYCGSIDWPALRELYKKYIGKVLEIKEADKSAGFEPLKRGWRR